MKVFDVRAGFPSDDFSIPLRFTCFFFSPLLLTLYGPIMQRVSNFMCVSKGNLENAVSQYAI